MRDAFHFFAFARYMWSETPTFFRWLFALMFAGFLFQSGIAGFLWRHFVVSGGGGYAG